MVIFRHLSVKFIDRENIDKSNTKNIFTANGTRNVAFHMTTDLGPVRATCRKKKNKYLLNKA